MGSICINQLTLLGFGDCTRDLWQFGRCSIISRDWCFNSHSSRRNPTRSPTRDLLQGINHSHKTWNMGHILENVLQVCRDLHDAVPPLDHERGERLLSPMVMCGPHGLRFNHPVELRLPHCASMTPDGWSFALKSSDAGKTSAQQVSFFRTFNVLTSLPGMAKYATGWSSRPKFCICANRPLLNWRLPLYYIKRLCANQKHDDRKTNVCMCLTLTLYI